jgi:hypothetical protein
MACGLALACISGTVMVYTVVTNDRYEIRWLPYTNENDIDLAEHDEQSNKTASCTYDGEDSVAPNSEQFPS